MKFVIVDDVHCEVQGQSYLTLQEVQGQSYLTLQEAMTELERRAAIPWEEEPNRAPCMSCRKCGRQYVIEEYDDTESGRSSRVLILEISAKGVEWQQRQIDH